MTEHRLEVADIFRPYGQEFLDRWGHVLSAEQRKAFQDIIACRTAVLGTQVQQCDHCGHQESAYRSCRNRHCPKCHSRTRDEWLRDRATEILPVPKCGLARYVVFNGVCAGCCPLRRSEEHIIYSDNRIVVHLIKEIRFVRSTVPLCRNGRTSFLCAFLQMKAKALAQ